MSDCCTPKGYRQLFNEKGARGQARRYRRKGLDSTSRRLVQLLKRRSLQDRTLLEVGGGIGAVQIELLKAGVGSAVSVELTPTYEDVAAELLCEAGLRNRVERRITDFAQAGSEVQAADIVVLNRVICCYPDMPALAGAAADRTRQVLVMSFPRESWWTRLAVRLGNLGLRLARRQFQVFLHPPARILATAEQHGLRTSFNEPGLFWQVTALERPAG
ncbi:MAG: SAM-dependent methyltransferase [Candidatus Nephthysia bennettiae]|uniref:SAM-dependent methyltransferase n=1 Tax=Candidatus Nephthysia bennettiae TaxID=3127016 RepID=A0A934N8J1_9BACT|nr:SAM-dependent methyltransferase [Candidatus Dormibacteraeota bacterium]PZR99853.1 MAG: SAM-dependent methyltransferase [Candidatus Dormibacteraeota bacterium]